MSKHSNMLAVVFLSIFLIGSTSKQPSRVNEIQQAIGAGDEVVIYLSMAQLTSFPYTKQRIQGAGTYITRIRCINGCDRNAGGLVRAFGTARLWPTQQKDCGDDFRSVVSISTNNVLEHIFISTDGHCIEFRNNVWQSNTDIVAFLRTAGPEQYSNPRPLR